LYSVSRVASTGISRSSKTVLGTSSCGLISTKTPVLEDAELVTTAKVGRARRCSVGPRRLEDVQEWTGTYRRMLDERLDRFGELLERTKGTPQ